MIKPIIFITVFFLLVFIPFLSSYKKNKDKFKKLGFSALLILFMFVQGCSSTKNYFDKNNNYEEKIVQELRYQYNIQIINQMHQQNLNNFKNNISKIYKK